jgi:hypothetical protein
MAVHPIFPGSLRMTLFFPSFRYPVDHKFLPCEICCHLKWKSVPFAFWWDQVKHYQSHLVQQHKYETPSLYSPFPIRLFETFICCLQQNENRYSLTMGSTLNYQFVDQIIATLSVVLLSQPTFQEIHICVSVKFHKVCFVKV